jgi:hypothetical protein
MTDIAEQIRHYLRARVALIVLVTIEEQRAIGILDEIQRNRGDLITWDYSDHFSYGDIPAATDPVTALDRIQDRVSKDAGRRDLYVLKDFHEFWSKDPRVRRRLRNLAQRLVYTGSSLVVTTHERKIPDELKDDAVVIDLPLPTEVALCAVLDKLVTTTRLEPV